MVTYILMSKCFLYWSGQKSQWHWLDVIYVILLTRILCEFCHSFLVCYPNQPAACFLNQILVFTRVKISYFKECLREKIVLVK